MLMLSFEITNNDHTMFLRSVYDLNKVQKQAKKQKTKKIKTTSSNNSIHSLIKGKFSSVKMCDPSLYPKYKKT